MVGSHARGNARADSDLDICLFTSKVEQFTGNPDWVYLFGKAEKIAQEQWGVVQTVRVHFGNKSEVEFNFCDLSWASVEPIDAGTAQVISSGVQILYDPTGSLEKLLQYFKKFVAPSL